jgi:hypothetical protein
VGIAKRSIEESEASIANAAVEQRLFAGGGVQTPTLRLFDQRDRKGPILRPDEQLGTILPLG